MSRAPCTFKRRDVTAGVRVARCEIDRDGKIILIAATDALVEPTDAEGIGLTKRIVL
jgi:hypothetical protein